MTIEDSLPEGEVMIKRGPGAAWEHATEEEKKELEAHEAQVKEDEENQKKHDEYLLACQDAARAQDYEDWAVASELERPCQQPSRKRIRVAVCVGSSAGLEVGHAIIEGNLPTDKQATVTFQVHETVLGGTDIEGGQGQEPGQGQEAEHAPPRASAAHEAGDMEDINVEELPELDDNVRDTLQSAEARTWLRRLRRAEATPQDVKEKFGESVAEAMLMWISQQEDHERDVLNCGEHGVGYIAPAKDDDDDSSSSSSSTNSQASILTRPYMPEESGALPYTEENALEGTGTGPGHHEELAQQGGWGEWARSLQGTSDQGLLADQDRGSGSCEGSGLLEGQGQGLLVRDGSQRREDQGDSAQGEPSKRCEGDGSLASEVRGESEDYVVPDAWKPVLRAWHDPAIGVGSEAPWPGLATPSGSGSGLVEDGEGTAAVADTMADASHTQLSDGEHTQPGNEPGEPSTSGSTELLDRKDGLGEGLKQTNLKSWLK